MSGKEQARQLTLTQRIALLSCQKAMEHAKRQFDGSVEQYRQVLTECGIDPDGTYTLTDDGKVVGGAK